MLSLDYDKKFDVLYIVLSNDSDSYGDESTVPGVITMRNIVTGEITGFTITEYKKKRDNGVLGSPSFPVNLNFDRDVFPYVN